MAVRSFFRVGRWARAENRIVGTTSDTVGVGTNLSITAKADRYKERSCLFLFHLVTLDVR